MSFTPCNEQRFLKFEPCLQYNSLLYVSVATLASKDLIVLADCLYLSDASFPLSRLLFQRAEVGLEVNLLANLFQLLEC